ncbi:glycoside hydrolase family 5 protein [Priestia megaterium]|uniref:glycoside hydrolase family 5 protein n=1 Tax=Priestia megaterium TaxID=1404 RepID=UPI00211E889D|nr:glycoside hydrolase family 5 protein [Priestia megaterium]
MLISSLTFVLFIFKFENNKPSDKQKSKAFFSHEIPNGFGVNIHFTGNPIDVDLIKDAGFNIVRQDIFWAKVEKKRGVFDFEGEGYDELTNALIDKKIRPYYILDYSNKLYEKGQSIVTKEGQDAFVRYVSEVTSRYKNKGIIWEIWNEPNGEYWESKPNFKEYSSLVKRVSKTIREHDPSGIVVAPALAGLNEESSKWLEEVFKEGILDDIDAVSVHPYRNSNPETVAYDYRNLRSLIMKYTKKEVPILSGEWGYSTARGPNSLNLDEQKQAEYFVRMFLINVLSDVPISIWYDWKNDGNNPLNGEHNFGLRKSDVNFSKRSYLAANVMMNYLSGFKFDKRIDLGKPNDYVLKFTNTDKKTVIVYWTTESPHKVDIPFKYKKGEILTIYGNKVGDIQALSSNKQEISSTPRYILINQ